jgi:hypothetical protein
MLVVEQGGDPCVDAGHDRGLAGVERQSARRVELRYALAAFRDLTAMHPAAGRGVPQALETAAALDDGWAFPEIRAALAAARERGATGAEGLERLGSEAFTM